jgi:hypothetical protein
MRDMMIKQNVQKQIVELLPQLSESTQIDLALNFVRHAIINFHDEYYNPQKLFKLICNYVQGQSRFSEVFEEYNKVRWVEGFPRRNRIPNDASIYIQKKYDLFFGLFDLCCYVGLKEFYNGWPKSPWDVSDISWNTAFVKALSVVGDDWNSNDLHCRQQARQKGHEISQEEKLWQLQQINDKLQMLE